MESSSCQQNIDARELHSQIERIIASRAFRRAGRSTAFLRFVAGKRLEGDFESFKEYTIAIEVFERPASYDPKVDSIVRVEAGKLRARLARYYETEGRADRFVVSLPKGGYALAVEERAAAPHPGASRRWILVSASFVVLVAVVAAATLARRDRSLAVMPLENGLGDPAVQYLADGLSEQIINLISGRPGLRVAARGASFRYRDPGDIKRAGLELGVHAVLAGRLTRRQNLLVVQAELVDTKDGSQLWGRQFEGPEGSIFDLSEEVARAVASEFGVSIPPATARPASNAAYVAYLKGRYFWGKHSHRSLQRAIEYAQEAIRNDDRYAPAYALLSDAYIANVWYGGARTADVLPKALEAVQKGQALNGDFAAVHVSLARISRLGGDWAGNLKHMEEALKLDPSNTDAWRGVGLHYLWAGNPSEARGFFQRAFDRDPLSVPTNINVGEYLYYTRQFDRAAEQYRKTIELDPAYFWAHERLGQAYEQMGKYDDAIAAYRKAIELGGDPRVLNGSIGHAHAASGHVNQARELLAAMMDESRKHYVPPYGIAMIFVGLGDYEQALHWLDKACDDRYAWIAWLRIDPRLDALRKTPRFSALLRKAGLPD